jgi:hypothetical protein
MLVAKKKLSKIKSMLPVDDEVSDIFPKKGILKNIASCKSKHAIRK